tara:strand:- start:260 stop:652 length:393 start_codon:yes stop_codon:yes gene_type:complete
MTKEKLKELQTEIAKLKEIDNKKTKRVTTELDAEMNLKKFYISGMAWIPSYRDFDQYDTTVEATSKDNALEVFNKTSMAKFMKHEPCIQTEKEWKDMCDRIDAMTTVCPPPIMEIPCSKEQDEEWVNESI